MKTVRDPSQQRLFDPFEGVIGSTGRKYIENGWQSLFRELLPDELLADAGYGSDANVELAKEADVELIAPVPGGKKYDADEVGYDQFELNSAPTEAHEVTACPAGHAPKSSTYNAKSNHVWAQMDRELCHVGPLLEHCVVQRDKQTGEANGRIQFRSDAPRAAQRRRHEQTNEFRDRYRWRSGIEATNSCVKRRLGMSRLRVRGFKAVKLSILLKLTGWNVLCAVALRGLQSTKARIALACS